MLNALLTTLEQLPLATALRGSVWVYPLVNAAHIVGVALLFGAIVALDLRLVGLFANVDTATLSRVLIPVAATGLFLAVVAGAMLFVTDARDYAASRLFQAKLAVIVVAVANAVFMVRLTAVAGGRARSGESRVVRITAAASIGLWLAAILLGRLVGYF